MKKLLLILCLSIFILSFVAAEPPFQTVIRSNDLTVSTNIPIAIPQNQSRYFNIHILNDTEQILSGATCSLHLYKESGDGSHSYSNISSTFTGGDITFLTNYSVHADKGAYSYKAICNTTEAAGLYEGGYYVTKNGFSPAEDNFKLFIYILFVLATILLFWTFLVTLAKLATTSMTFFDVIIAWLGIILTMISVYLGENYLISTFVENLGNTFITITIWSNGVLPLIALVVTMFVKGTQKKKPLAIKDLAGKRLINYGG